MPGEKDFWEKLDVLLKPMGGIIAAGTIATLGFISQDYLERRQIVESNARLYADIMSKREEADSNLRKDMFDSIIRSFFGASEASTLDSKVLNLEILAYNFHDALDLGPLFKDVHRHIWKELVRIGGELRRVEPTGTTEGTRKEELEERREDQEELLDRLELVARDVNGKQVAALEESGLHWDGTVHFAELSESPGGITVIDRQQLDENTYFKVEVLKRYAEEKELQIKLTVWSRGDDGDWGLITPIFPLGFFDFPMIDNTRLGANQRCAVVLREWLDSGAEVQLIYFPASRASLKERPYYEEMLQQILQERDRTAEAQ